MPPIQVGMIGCGSRPIRLLRSLPGLGTAIRIAAVCDPHRPYRDALCREHAPDAVVHDTADALLAHPGLDWIWISSWNHDHARHAIAAFKSGRHVFCEKPLATSLDDALAIRDAADAAGRMFSFGLVLRYSPHYQAIRDRLDAGEIGRPLSLECNEILHFDHGGYIHGDWRRLTEQAGPHCLEKCCHDIDILHWLLGSLPERVASFGGCNFFTPDNLHHAGRIGRNETGRLAYQTWDHAQAHCPFTSEKDIVDNQVAILSFPGGVHASIHMSGHSAIPERRLFLCGSEGTLRADLVARRIEVARCGYPVEIREIGAGSQGEHGGGDRILGERLAASMREGAAPLAGMTEGLASTATCLAIEEARISGRVVDLAPTWKRLGLSTP